MKQLFGLDNEPQYLLTKVSDIRVEFGELDDGSVYKLPEAKKIPHQRFHTRNAATLCHAAYKTDPVEFLKKKCHNHTIQSVVAKSQYSKQMVMVAVAKVGEFPKETVMYVVYRGTQNRDDFMTDININQKEKDFMPYNGTYHAGFEERANVLPTKYILDYAKEMHCKTIITCGHSMDGAVSSIVALDLLINEVNRDEMEAYNITFGAPFFGNIDVKEMCKSERLENNILHYVDYKDIVPGLLSLGHTSSMLKTKDIQVSGESLASYV